MSKVLGPDYRAYTDDIHLAAEASMRMACQLSPSTAGGSADSLSFTLRAPTNALRIRLGLLTYPTKRLSNKCILYIYIYIRYACSIVQSTHSLASQRADDTKLWISWNCCWLLLVVFCTCWYVMVPLLAPLIDPKVFHPRCTKRRRHTRHDARQSRCRAAPCPADVRIWVVLRGVPFCEQSRRR